MRHNIQYKDGNGQTGRPQAPYPANAVHSTVSPYGTVWVSSLPAAGSQGCSRHLEEVLLGGGHAGADIRVLVVDDVEILRRGIGRILQSQADIEIIGEASDGADAVRKVREYKPQVVLLDITCH